MELLHGEIKRGILMKQGHVVKSWKERLFVLRSDRLCYYENEPGKPLPRPKGTLLLSDIVTCTAQNGCSFLISVAGVDGQVDYFVMALTEKEK
jgi:hypothetical protein